jgi:4-hydroxybenzoate polyprenyltransferase
VKTPSLGRRFLTYQAERFPLAGFAPLITLFTFSSAAFSRRARGAEGFVEVGPFVVGAFTSLTFFFLLRVLDEHKDQVYDQRYRPELPVPRGLVSLAELRAIGAAAGAAAVALNLWVAPVMIWPLLLAAAWAALMTREFFVPVWLRAHPTAYLLTHMAIMPLIDGYTTGLDWLIAGAHTPGGLGWFLAVTFANGVLIEVGRKLRVPDGEREGVDTYTKAWGLRTAPAVWLATLAASGVLAVLAAVHTGTATIAAVILAVLAVPCAAPAVSFLRRPAAKAAGRIELASQAWPAVTYVVLGALPFAVALLARP